MENFDKQEYSGTEIAIIGMSGRFPQSDNLNDFWENLCKGKELIHFFTRDEMISNGVAQETINNKNFVPSEAILNNLDKFDAPFFGLSPNEATISDPQQRIFLECAWEALEDAGYNPDTYKGLIGVFAGTGPNSYYKYHINTNPDVSSYFGFFPINIGNDFNFFCTRVSYLLNLKGPSVVVQSACSTSLVAVHMACQSLLTGESDMVLAGGVKSSMPVSYGHTFFEGGTVSKDGHCRPFDAKGDGFVNGNGAGIVVLKRLEDAINDNDHIYAVIKGSSINNDGIVKIGYTAPGIDGQVKVIKDAMAIANVDSSSVLYVETHGTGTNLGDPIEIEALSKAFNTNKKGYCAIGSVKSNIGHLDTAAGIAGLIKASLSLKNNLIPPSINYSEANPHIDFQNSPFYVNTTLRKFEAGVFPHRVAVSSFGIGGTNAHIVLEEAPVRASYPSARKWKLLLLSAKTENSLKQSKENILNYLNRYPETELADLAYTLQTGRKDFSCRQYFVSENATEVVKVLGMDTPMDHAKEGNIPVFLFPGEGTFLDMGLELYKCEPAFQEELDVCFDILSNLTNLNVKEFLFSGEKGLVKHSNISLSLLFSIEYSLARVLIALGIKPGTMIGQGIGELVAACISGVISMEDALCLVRQIEEESEWHEKGLDSIRLSMPAIPFISCRTGKWITDEACLNLAYWIMLVKQGFSFNTDFSAVTLTDNHVFIELGPEDKLGKAIAKNSNEKVGIISIFNEQSEESKGSYSFIQAVGRLWQKGFSIDWTNFYKNEKRNRISIPTYAFDRKRYWIEPGTPELAKAALNKLELLHADISDWFYVPTWEQSFIPFHVKDTGQLNILFFANEETICKQLIGKLKEEKHHIVTVKIGESYKERSSKEFTINPANEDNYIKLFSQLNDNNFLPHRIVHVWSSGKKSGSKPNFNIIQDTGFYSLLCIAKAVGTTGMSHKIGVDVITTDLHPVDGTETLTPEKATIIGAVKIIPLEYTNISCRNIDIGYSPSKEKALHYAGKIINEIYREVDDVIVSFRHNYRWIQGFRPVKIEKTDHLAVKNNGVYLITGGLGGIGYSIATYLAGNYKATLVLTGRTKVPAREQWESYLNTHGENDLVSLSVKKLNKVEDLGAKVKYFGIDVANASEMQQAIVVAEAEFGKINGVFHTAGVADFEGIIQKRTKEQTEKILRPKIQGALVLNSILKKNKLDFFVCFSSLGNILYNNQYGQVGYNAANEFLDAFVHSLNHSDEYTKIKVINWNTWTEVGMAEEALKKRVNQVAGANEKSDSSLTPEQGIEVLERVLNSSLVQVAISSVSLSELIKKSKEKKEVVSSGPAQNALNLNPRPDIGAEYVEPATEIGRKLSDIFKTFFGYEKVGVNDDFFDLGGDSLTATVIIQKIQSQFGDGISLQDFINNSKISKLESVIEKKQNVNRKNNVVKHAERLFLKQADFKIYATFNYPGNVMGPRTGVLFFAPLGHEQIYSSHSFVKLADTLSDQGFYVCRFDYLGTGESDKDLETVSVSELLKSAEIAERVFTSKFSIEKLYAVGLRFGATLLSLFASDKEMDGIVLWNPVINGKEYIRELKRAHAKWKEGSFASYKAKDNALEFLGFNYSNSLLHELRDMDLLKTGLLKHHKALLIGNKSDISVLNYVKVYSRNNGILALYDKCNTDFWQKQNDEAAKKLIPLEEIEKIVSWIKKQ